MRYAIYYCPTADTALGQLGGEWLANAAGAEVRVPGISAERRKTLLADVRRYGWHATIRAPFALAPNATYDDVRRAVTTLAQAFASFDLPLRLARLADFLVLRPTFDGGPERTLAAACLKVLQPISAPLTSQALQRRRAGLDAEELTLLHQHGYPYVLDRYRFHLTISAAANETEEHAMRAWLQPRVAALPPTRIDALSICREATPGDAFALLERIALRTAGPECLS